MQTKSSKIKKLLGRAEKIDLPEQGMSGVPARIDTGAKTSSIWATAIQERDGVLRYMLFSKDSPYFTGALLVTSDYEKIVVACSIGAVQERYKVKLLIKLKGRKVRARFTLADRSQQAYPVLMGRNVLRGKFVVDVQDGKPLYKEERQRSHNLQSKMVKKESV